MTTHKPQKNLGWWDNRGKLTVLRRGLGNAHPEPRERGEVHAQSAVDVPFPAQVFDHESERALQRPNMIAAAWRWLIDKRPKYDPRKTIEQNWPLFEVGLSLVVAVGIVISVLILLT